MTCLHQDQNKVIGIRVFLTLLFKLPCTFTEKFGLFIYICVHTYFVEKTPRSGDNCIW